MRCAEVVACWAVSGLIITYTEDDGQDDGQDDGELITIHSNSPLMP